LAILTPHENSPTTYKHAKRGEVGLATIFLLPVGAPFDPQLIPKRTVHDKFPKAPDITPKFRTAYLEVITVGVRDLKPYGFQARYPVYF